MRNLQYEIILYLGLFFTLLVGVGRASEKIIEADSLTKLPNEVTKVILGYLKIPTCFNYLLLTKAAFGNKNLRKCMTERALWEHCVPLMTPDHSLPNYWNRLQYFLDVHLDSTITVPELPLVPIFCTRHPRMTETELVTHCRTYGDFWYITTIGNISSYTRGKHLDGCLPLIYDPMQSMLHIYPTQEHKCKYSSRVRLPALLILKHLAMSPTFMWISKMPVTKWECVTKDGRSIITSNLLSTLEVWEFFINPMGIVTAINFWVNDTKECCPFYSEEGKNQGKTFTIDPLRENSGFTEIKAFYLPSTVYV